MFAYSAASMVDPSIRRALRQVRPRTLGQLEAWVRIVLGLSIPRRALVAGHDAPLEYLAHAFFEDARAHRNVLVWAARGSGKTLLGAVATLLDMLFKPGIEICILGGSFAQSSRMHQHLARMLRDPAFADLVDGRITLEHVRLRNGSSVEVLSQSQTAVRGRRAHRLRCDEVELFEPEVWEAAQLITRSGRCGSIDVRAGVEALSTMHKPFGLMSRLAQNAAHSDTRVIRWSVIDVLELCPDSRACADCGLFDEHDGGCHGLAKNDRKVAAVGSDAAATDCGAAAARCQAADPHDSVTAAEPACAAFSQNPNRFPQRDPRTGGSGYFRIDDALDQRSRIGIDTWRSEMLCERPDVSDSVYPAFEPLLHVFDDDRPVRSVASATWLAGMDIGFRAPTVLLLAIIDGANVLHVIDEIVERSCPTPRMIALARQRLESMGVLVPRDDDAPRERALSSAMRDHPHRAPGRLAWIGVDPAGLQRSDQTGASTVALWRRAGFVMRPRAVRLETGIAAVRDRLRSADGRIGLRIHARCAELIRSLRCYRYPSDRGDDAQPLKDGHDHAADALRYLVINLDRDSHHARIRDYLVEDHR